MLKTAVFIAVSLLNIGAINSTFVDLLAPYQDANTQAAIEFTEYQHSSIHIEKLKLKAFLWKLGPSNEFDLRLEPVVYDATNANHPMVQFSAKMGLDMVVAFGQDVLNDYAEELDILAADLAKDLASELGNAVDAQAEITEKLIDKNGDVTSVKMEMSIKIDLSQLPPDKDPSDVPITAVTGELKADRAGLYISADISINPAYKGFHDSLGGLKETLEKLVNRDPQTVDQFKEGFEFVLDIANDLTK